MSLSLHDFQYYLPEKLIAQSPAHPRDSARLLLLNRQTHTISHHRISDLPNLLPQILSNLLKNIQKLVIDFLISDKIPEILSYH